MDFYEKEALFSTYFGAILHDLYYLRAHAPSDAIEKEIVWMEKHQDIMENKFLEKDFMFLLGFVVYTATNI